MDEIGGKIFDFEFLFIPTLVELPVWVLKITSNRSLRRRGDFTQGGKILTPQSTSKLTTAPGLKAGQ